MNGPGIEISVIIPVYQAKGHLEDCFESLMESVRNIIDNVLNRENAVQIILVDDGSTDGSSGICDRLESENVIVRHTKNSGVSHARNVGIDLAKGRFIVFLDSDDRVSEDFLTDLYLAMESNRVPVVDMMESLPDTDILSGRRFIEDAILYSDTHVWGKLFSTGYIKEKSVRFREGLTIGEDMLFLMELAVKAGDDPFAAKASPNGYYYTDNEQGAMKRSFAASYLDQISCWKHAQRLMQTAPYDFDKRCYDRLSEIQIMSAMLVAGKIACMDKKANNDEDLVRLALDTCSDSLEEAGLLGKGFRRLSKGYKVKVLLYKLNRELYLKVYGKWKS